MLSHPPLLIDQLENELINVERAKVFDCASSSESHQGRVRAINEDAFLAHSDEHLWVVADGMGGHSRGDYASKAAIRALSDYQTQATLAESLGDLQARIDEANTQCQGAFRGKRIGTTLAGLHIFAGLALVIWAGDSRVYRLRNGELLQLSRDHSVAEEKRARGELSVQAAEAHASAHVLTRAVGVHKKVFPELKCEPVMSGDRYFLCTDGALLGMTHERLSAILTEPVRQDAVSGIVAQALDNGGRDNITAIIVDII
jgi:serine/threonine protein phosphatase PrpC